MGGSSGKKAASEKTPEEVAAEYEKMCQGYDGKTHAAQVTAEELRSWVEDTTQEVVIFDVRGKGENAVSTLTGTRLLPPTTAGMAKAMSGTGRLSFDAEVPKADTIPLGAKVVCHCTAGLRSGFAAVALQEAWKKQGANVTVYNLHGGIIAWANAGGAVVDPQSGEARNAVHVYGSQWEPYLEAREGMQAVKF